MKSGILLSACMIVKDEAHNMSRCLNSIKDFVDEIVVVDTGSTDDTVKIAENFGARVYHHPWQNDFSLHRNQSLDYARGDWCLIIDADEELVFPTVEMIKIRNFFRGIPKKFPAVAILLKDIQKGSNVMQFNTTRFFRRGTCHYEGIVHNQPQVSGDAIFTDSMVVNHYGYDLSPDQKDKKFERTKALLLRQVEQGRLVDGLAYFYLCQLYAEHRNPDDAVAWGEKYWDMACRGEIPVEHFNVTIYFSMTKQYMKIGDRVKAQEWLQRGINKLPGDLDISMAAVEFGIWTEDPELQVSAAKDFIELYNSYQNNPMQKRGKFVFCLRPEALILAMSRIAIVQLKEGSKALGSLMQEFPKVAMPYRKGILIEIEEALKESNIPIKFVTEQESMPQGIGDQNKQRLTTMQLH